MAKGTLDFDPLCQRLHVLRSTDLDETWVDCTGKNSEEIRKRYRDLEQPCYGFIDALRDIDGLDLLADHAQLQPAPLLRPFPYRVPRPPIDQEFVEIWSPGKAQETDDAMACSRLLLWFAVAHNPIEFGADLLFWQQLQRALPLYCPKGDQLSRPIVRIKIGVYEAARGLFDAVHDGAGENLDTDTSQPQNVEVENPDMRAFRTKSAIARHIGVNISTIRRWEKSGRIRIQKRSDGTHVCSQIELARESEARKR